MGERTAESRFVVSHWIIPNGTRYDIAYTATEFFNTKAEADRYADDAGRMPPEMAEVFAVEEWDAAAMPTRKETGQ